MNQTIDHEIERNQATVASTSNRDQKHEEKTAHDDMPLCSAESDNGMVAVCFENNMITADVSTQNVNEKQPSTVKIQDGHVSSSSDNSFCDENVDEYAVLCKKISEIEYKKKGEDLEFDIEVAGLEQKKHVLDQKKHAIENEKHAIEDDIQRLTFNKRKIDNSTGVELDKLKLELKLFKLKSRKSRKNK